MAAVIAESAKGYRRAEEGGAEAGKPGGAIAERPQIWNGNELGGWGQEFSGVFFANGNQVTCSGCPSGTIGTVGQLTGRALRIAPRSKGQAL